MRITDEHVDYILDLIEGWGIEDGTLTVPRLLDRFRLKYGDAPSDRAIRNYSKITQRILDRKEEILTGRALGDSNKKPSSLAHAIKVLQKLEAQNEVLKRRNDEFKNKFVTWQKNAYDFGMTKDQLNKPLPVNSQTIISQDR